MKGTLYECIAWLEGQDPKKRYEAKVVKPSRSLTQNAYYWAMLNRLARKLGMSDSETHLNMLREYGVFWFVTLALTVPPEECFKYYDVLGHDWVDGQEGLTVKVYKRSSRMDSTEFSHLIDGMRQECEQQGIDVATPEEIARMRFIEPERKEI